MKKNKFILFVLILYFPDNIFSHVRTGFLGLTSTKQRIKCFAQGHKALKAVPPVKKIDWINDIHFNTRHC